MRERMPTVAGECECEFVLTHKTIAEAIHETD